MAAGKKIESTFDVMNRQAAAGDIVGLMNTLVNDGHGVAQGERKGELIQAATAAAAKNCPRMIDAVLAMSIANTTELLMRATFMAKVKMMSGDKHSGPFTAGIPQEVADHDLPRITRLEDRLIALAKARATILHTCRLVDQPLPNGRIIKLHDGQRALASGE